MNQDTQPAARTGSTPEEQAGPASQDNGVTPPATVQPVDPAAQEDAGQDRADGGGYT